MKYIALDIETSSLKPGVIWIVSVGEQLFHDCNGLKGLPKSVVSKLESPNYCKVIHSAEFDAYFIALSLGIRIRNICDTRLREVIIQGFQLPRNNKKSKTPAEEALAKRYSSALKYTLPRYKLPTLNKDIRKQFINRPLGQPFTKEELEYAAADTRHLITLMERQHPQPEINELEMQFVEKVVDMRVLGIGVDQNLWNNIARKNRAMYDKLLSELPKKVENWNSPAQVKKYFCSIGVELNSFADIEKVFIKTQCATLLKFIRARKYYSSATTYGSQWLDGVVDADGRIRPSYEQILNTGRISTSKPNVLALPKESEQREAIIPAKGRVFVIGDWGGQEIGIMASASGESKWIKAMLNGEDVHAITAATISPGEWQRATERGCLFPKKCNCKGHKRLREPAKQSNFLLAYGGGADKLIEKQIESLFKRTEDFMDFSSVMSQFEARLFIKKHKRAIPKLIEYLDNNGKRALRDKVSYSADPYRRMRNLKGEEDWQIINQGKNNPIQSAGANMMKRAVNNIQFPVILPFHDELLCEVPKAQAKACMKNMKLVMEEAANYITGIPGLIKVEPRVALNFKKI